MGKWRVEKATKIRRPFIRFFACEKDLSHQAPDELLPEAVADGSQVFLIIGAIAGGRRHANEDYVRAVEGILWLSSRRIRMRLNRSIERYIDHIDRSRVWLQLLGGVCWLAGAGLSAAWMVHGGGAVRPLASFAAWATGLCFIMVRARANTSEAVPTRSEVTRALRYGGYSVLLLALGTLFFEYWPVTVSMACMFAVCRGFKESDDTPAYV